jgi:hypothetical protein
METTMIQALDKVLAHLNAVSDFKTEKQLSNRQLSNLGISNMDIYYIYEKLVSDNYIDSGTEISAGVYLTKLTASGREFINRGGYEKQEKDLIDTKEQDKRIKILTERQLKQNVFNLRYWWLLMIINILLSAIVAFLVKLL